MPIFVAVLLATFSIFLFPKTIYAQQYFFQEEFNEVRPINTLDPNKWSVYSNNPSGVTTILENGGNLILSQVTSSKFPFVTSKNQIFPEDNWTAEIKFRYTKVTGYGTGIALSDKGDHIQNPTAPELLRIDVWQDLYLTNMRLEYNGQIVLNIPVNLDDHVFKVERIGLKYLVYLDNNLVFTSEDTNTQVKYIWMGNYVTVPAGNWTSFNVDYIRIKELLSKTPLILIPGIGGSELKVEEDTIWNRDDGHGGVFNRIYPKDEKVWVNEVEAANPGEDDYFDVLRMKPDGVTSEANVGLSGNLYSGAYQEAVDFFTSNGYTLNKDFFVFPYDWRLDLALTASILDEKINQIKTQTGSTKVDIVAHSMGGLVARNYIADPTRAQNVRKLFTLGTPHLGAVKFIKAIRYGDCLFLEIGPFCLSIAPSEVQDVIQNMISGFQLAPSQSYFNFYSNEDNQHPYPYRTELEALNYNQIKNLLTTYGHNTSLFTPSESFHNLNDSFPNTNGVEVINIAGSGQSTLGQIIEQKQISLLGIESVHKDVININGDDTVPLFSASLNDPSKNRSLLGNAKIYYANQIHRDLVKNGPALNLVKNILEGSDQLPSGVSDQPYNLNGTTLSVHSPVNIHIYDSSGNHTGPTAGGHFETNISESSYDTLGDAKFIYLPENGVYNIKFDATDNGSFDFKIRKYENNENTETILYKEIPLTDNTKAEAILYTASNQPPTVNVDENGDGSFDFNVEHFSILEGGANFDYIPPTISFDVNPKSIWPPNNRMVDVNITGAITDDNPYLTTIIVDDEYNLVEPKVTIQNQTNINQVIKLEASRKGNDKDGRKYTIKILVTDLAGNTSLSTLEVTVPHDQGKKK